MKPSNNNIATDTLSTRPITETDTVPVNKILTRNKDRFAKYNCAIEATLDLIGGKYKSIILWHLISRTLRFNEISKEIPQATPKMLTQQLRELEHDGLINRVVYPVIPPKVEYSLSEFGESIVPVLSSMRNWGHHYMKDYINE
jgi:DNA-binding HxlR family transcriptional regulator